MIDLLQRYQGALLGVLAGDSAGAPYETWDSKRIRADIRARGGLKFFDYPNPWNKDGNGDLLPAGRPTDDSDQTADLAFSLIACGRLDPDHLREALRDSCIRKQSRLWDGKATGAGKTTRDALSDDPKRNEKARKNNIGTNGSLMRCVPLILFYFERDDIDVALESMSKVTHNHPHSIDACSMYAECLQAILRGEDKSDILRLLDELRKDSGSLMKQRVAIALADENLFPVDPGTWPARGTAEFSLYTALWCFKHSKSFEDGIERAVRVGGDTDTYAAIAGGLLGAYYGYGGIPEDWRKAILGHDVVMKYADRLY